MKGRRATDEIRRMVLTLAAILFSIPRVVQYLGQLRRGEEATVSRDGHPPLPWRDRADVVTIVAVDVLDIRFPTSRLLDGSDAMSPDPDYSAAYVILRTDAGDGLEGHGLTF